METFRDDKGALISTVNHLSQEIEVETVFHGKAKAECLRIYLDADHPDSDGSKRPQIYIELAEDGRTVRKIQFPKRCSEIIAR